MDKSEIKQIENMIEVVVRSIPKERQARDTFLAASREAKCEMARVLLNAWPIRRSSTRLSCGHLWKF